MRRLAVLGLLPLFAVGIVVATPAPKVFVCKYVGTPGVNETLQTGQNPISVSSNAIQNYKGVGSSFNDQQGRSFVVAEDTGQPTPTCPAGQTPPPVVVPPVPPTPPATPPSTPNPTSTPSTTQTNTDEVTPESVGQGK